MDPVKRRVLQAEIQAQLNAVNRVYGVIEERAKNLDEGSIAEVEGLAYQLHNFYNAVEDLMQIVAGAFENHVTDLSRWHTQLLDRMKLDIEGVRPALFTEETAALLHQLRAFRHFFRHAYGVPLDPEKVNQNRERAQRLHPLVTRDVQAFLSALAADDES